MTFAKLSVSLSPIVPLRESSYENEAVEYIGKIERQVRRNPGISVAGPKGKLHGQLPERHADALIGGVLAGYERPDLDDLDDDDLPDWRTRERLPEWHVHSITVDGEEFAASAGNGETMTEVVSHEEIWDSTRALNEEWREDPFADPSCNECESGVYELTSIYKKNGKFTSHFTFGCCSSEYYS